MISVLGVCGFGNAATFSEPANGRALGEAVVVPVDPVTGTESSAVQPAYLAWMSSAVRPELRSARTCWRVAVQVWAEAGRPASPARSTEDRVRVFKSPEERSMGLSSRPKPRIRLRWMPRIAPSTLPDRARRSEGDSGPQIVQELKVICNYSFMARESPPRGGIPGADRELPPQIGRRRRQLVAHAHAQ